jgi:hypothetical protein
LVEAKGPRKSVPRITAADEGAAAADGEAAAADGLALPPMGKGHLGPLGPTLGAPGGEAAAKSRPRDK